MPGWYVSWIGLALGVVLGFRSQGLLLRFERSSMGVQTLPRYGGAYAYSWLEGLGLRYQAHRIRTGHEAPLPPSYRVARVAPTKGERLL